MPNFLRSFDNVKVVQNTSNHAPSKENLCHGGTGNYQTIVKLEANHNLIWPFPDYKSNDLTS